MPPCRAQSDGYPSRLDAFRVYALGKGFNHINWIRKTMPVRKTTARAATIEKSKSEGAGLIKSVDKAVNILQELYAAHRPLRVSELAKALSLSPSVVSRIISTFASSGLVDIDEETGRIYLGLGLVLLGNSALGRRKLDYLAIPVMARLAEQFEEYVSLSRLVGKRV